MEARPPWLPVPGNRLPRCLTPELQDITAHSQSASGEPGGCYHAAPVVGKCLPHKRRSRGSCGPDLSVAEGRACRAGVTSAMVGAPRAQPRSGNVTVCYVTSVSQSSHPSEMDCDGWNLAGKVGAGYSEPSGDQEASRSCWSIQAAGPASP